jgi:tyrosyl-tRNA synthetase
MSKIITDKKRVDDFLTRGVENIYPTRDWVREQMFAGKKLKMYLGIDPTGPSLHIGHAIPMIKLQEFQELGHEAILLIGDFTGMIGDPTDKKSTRQKLTSKQVVENCKNYKKQAEKIIDFKKCQIKFNSKWLGKMKFDEVVELASNFTVQRMLERDMFEKRIKEEKPVYLHEFLYPIMQGYDSVVMSVDGEIGGNDQTFNMLAGRTLMKSLKNKEKFVLTCKLLADPTGKKMGKSEGNMITLTDDSNDKFGKVMSWSDDVILISFEILTRKNLDEIKSRLDSGENPRNLKIELAYEVVKNFDGEVAAEKAKESFINVFSKKENPEEIVKIKISKNNILLIDLLMEMKLVDSKSEAKRMVEQGAVKINDQKIIDWKNEVVVKKGDIVRVGKRRFAQVNI